MQSSRALPVPSRKTITSASPTLITPALLLAVAVGLAIGGPFAIAGNEPVAAATLVALAVVALGMALLVVRRAHSTEAALATANEHIHDREHRLRLLLEATDSSITVVDRDGVITNQNSAITGLIGRYPFEITGQPLRSLFGEQNEQRVVGWMANAALHGACHVPRVNLSGIGFPDRWLTLTFLNLLDEPTVAGIVITARDTTDLVVAEQREQHLRTTDALTGLGNRAELIKAIPRASETGGLVALIDLVSFSAINREFGEQAGDSILQVVAWRLRQSTVANDELARLDGDRFALVLPGEGAEEHLAHILSDAFNRPAIIGEQEVWLRAKCGYCQMNAADNARLLINAETALHFSRRSDGAQSVAWSPMVEEQARWSPDVSEIRVGLQNNEFALHYQPIISLETGETREVEALLRWNHPRRGLVGPAEVLALAEACDLIQPLTWWTIDEACRQGAEWHRQRPSHPMSISVNLSARVLLADDLTQRVSQALDRNGFGAKYLRLELVESTLIEDLPAARDALEQLKTLGVQLALDDFGIGFSSLAYLQHFPIDVIKIDRSFIQAMPTQTNSMEIVRSIIDLARRLNLKTTAEGVETKEQLDRLRELGPDCAQGFLIARPLSPERIVLGSLDNLLSTAA